MLIDGKLISNQIKEELSKEVLELKNKYGRTPKLAVILVGDDPASHVYVRNKEKACEKVGIENLLIKKDASITELILNDGIITSDIMSTWSTYSIKKMTYVKEIMEGYHQYEVQIKVTGQQIAVPGNNDVIVSKTNEYTIIKVYMNLHYSSLRNGYLIKSIDLPSQN